MADPLVSSPVVDVLAFRSDHQQNPRHRKRWRRRAEQDGLKRELEARSLPNSGLKKDLVSRIIQYDAACGRSTSAQRGYATRLANLTGIRIEGKHFANKVLMSELIDKLKAAQVHRVGSKA